MTFTRYRKTIEPLIDYGNTQKTINVSLPIDVQVNIDFHKRKSVVFYSLENAECCIFNKSVPPFEKAVEILFYH